jgi:hypothetical protein
VGRYLDLLRDEDSQIRDREKSELSEESPPSPPLNSLSSLISHSDTLVGEHLDMTEPIAEPRGLEPLLPRLPPAKKAKETKGAGADVMSRWADAFAALSEQTESAPTSAAPATWGEAEEERAAIVEDDGKIPRAWAEGFARLDPNRPPGDVPAKRWLRFVDDVGTFLDSPFCAVAAALGWGPYDLFGCDRDRPFARIDQAGLLWLLGGDKLIALTENTATIKTRTGARQTYRRKTVEFGRVLAWELVP